MFSALPGRGAHGEYAKFPPAISLWTADCGIFGSGRETVGRAAGAGVRDRLAVFSLGQELADAQRLWSEQQSQPGREHRQGRRLRHQALP